MPEELMIVKKTTPRTRFLTGAVAAGALAAGPLGTVSANAALGNRRGPTGLPDRARPCREGAARR
ncbi:hypothetical protein [Streptomyces sp. NK15101]|uniref:hypothetical protein n=1 Tax=Streptomyces sp. NK15101 TaxID=2873261 RepID=UPI001CEDAB47|nr:hypothetical protein [Streptomyces sp. NK15101]